MSYVETVDLVLGSLIEAMLANRPPLFLRFTAFDLTVAMNELM